MTFARRYPAVVLSALLAAACSHGPPEPYRLPTGAMLDPAGESIQLGSMPLGMALSPDSTRVAVVLSGYREQGVQIVSRDSNRVIQTLVQPAAFLGVAFAPDGRTLYVSGGDQDLIYRYAWQGDTAVLRDSLSLHRSRREAKGSRYPAGLALSRDGKWLYVAENLADSLAVINLATGKVVQRLPTGRYPYGVAVGPRGRVYVSAWGEIWVASFARTRRGLALRDRIPVGHHPSAMALNARGTRLFVTLATKDGIAVVDLQKRVKLGELADSAPRGPPEGSTPDGLALSHDGRTLYVAEADNNAVAIFRLGARMADDSAAPKQDALLGRVPVEWYPTDVLPLRDTLLVLNGKGAGTGSNPDRGQPLHKRGGPRSYTLGQTTGSLTTMALPTGLVLDSLSRRVARANNWNRARPDSTYPAFTHVIYVLKENRTYDQVLGDLKMGDGDSSLVYFGRDVTPNEHALAERFGDFDRFFVNAEVSADGHNWSMAAYASDYDEKTTPSNYSNRGRTYDYEGLNRDVPAENDVNEPGNGYLWDLAQRAGTSFRNYGEFTDDEHGRWVGTKFFLSEHTDPAYPGWNLDIPDQKRADEWLREFKGFVAADTLPAFEIVYLPNDHTSGGAAGEPTPRADVADNDYALGRIVDALSRSPFWKNTVVFVLEDDAQDGPDHVDSHRSPLFVISAYNRPGVIHRWTNTTDVVATIDGILRLGALSQFDYYGRPLQGIFAATPDTTPYDVLKPRISLDEKNPSRTAMARASRGLDLARPDQANEALFNRILWRMIKGPERPYPGATRIPLRDLKGES